MDDPAELADEDDSPWTCDAELEAHPKPRAAAITRNVAHMTITAFLFIG